MAEQDETRENLLKAIMLLDCALPYFEKAAQAEKRRPPQGRLKEITCQRRLEAVREMIKEVGPTVGYEEW